MTATDSDNLQSMTDSITVWLQVRLSRKHNSQSAASGNQIVAAWE